MRTDRACGATDRSYLLYKKAVLSCPVPSIQTRCGFCECLPPAEVDWSGTEGVGNCTRVHGGRVAHVQPYSTHLCNTPFCCALHAGVPRVPVKFILSVTAP